MTWAQWVLEYHALQRKEKETNDTVIAVFKQTERMLISLFGLQFAPSKVGESDEELRKKLVPLSYIVGRPDALKYYLEKAQNAQREEAAAKDEDFETFSAELHKQAKTGMSALPGDMVPLLLDGLPEIERNSYWHSEEAKDALRVLGIKPRAETRAVPHIDKRPKVLEAKQDSMLSEEELVMLGERPKRTRVPVDREAELEKFRRALSGK